jgi:nucleotide-binding universal stress UspA family protein
LNGRPDSSGIGDKEMPMPKPTPLTVLVATDLSASSRHAAHRAAMLAQQLNGSLDLLHVLELTLLQDVRRILGDAELDMESRIVAQSRDALAQLASDINHQQQIKSNVQLVQGPLLSGITDTAHRLDARLLVVGASSAGYLRHWLLGATADRLLRKTTLPILFVRQPAHEQYRNVLLPIDFSACSATAVTFARMLAPRARLMLHHACAMPFEGKMRFAGVADDTVMHYRQGARRDALAGLEKLATDAGLAPDQWLPVVTQGDPAHDILEQQVDLDADLIVLGKQGSGMTGELLLGSVTQQVLGQTHCDIAVTPC